MDWKSENGDFDGKLKLRQLDEHPLVSGWRRIGSELQSIIGRKPGQIVDKLSESDAEQLGSSTSSCGISPSRPNRLPAVAIFAPPGGSNPRAGAVSIACWIQGPRTPSVRGPWPRTSGLTIPRRAGPVFITPGPTEGGLRIWVKPRFPWPSRTGFARRRPFKWRM